MDRVWGLGEACQIDMSSIKNGISTSMGEEVIRKNIYGREGEGKQTFELM